MRNPYELPSTVLLDHNVSVVPGLSCRCRSICASTVACCADALLRTSPSCIRLCFKAELSDETLATSVWARSMRVGCYDRVSGVWVVCLGQILQVGCKGETSTYEWIWEETRCGASNYVTEWHTYVRNAQPAGVREMRTS